MRYSSPNRLHFKELLSRRQRYLVLLTAVFVALFQSGCVAPGNLGLSATNLNFGGVPVGSSKSQIVNIMNSGDGPFTITTAAVSGKGFDIKAPSLPLTLAVGQSAQFTTTFAPAAIGNTSGSVLITKSQWSSPQLMSGSVSPTSSLATQQTTIAMTGAGVPPTPLITTQPVSQTVTASQTATFSVTSSGAAPLSYQWMKNGTSINGATSSSYTTPSETTSDGGAQFTVVVSNSAGSVTSNAAILTVNAAPGASLQIATNLLPNAQVGVQFQASLAAAGGVQPYHWSIVSGTLPAGLSLNADTGVLSGTAASGKQSGFSVQVSDSSSPTPQTSMKALTLSVLAFALLINSGGLPNGQVGVQFDASVSASGGVTPYTWAVMGSLPTGLSLNASSGAITGTPTQVGTSTFAIVLTDSAQQTAQKSLSMTISAPGVQPLSISTTTLSQPTLGQSYSATLQATGGTSPYTWTVTSGQLPTGLALNSFTGKLAGMPTSEGHYSFAAQVQDSGAPPQTASRSFNVNVTASVDSSLDQYGGDANHACVGTMPGGGTIPGSTGFFYVYKDTNAKHWFFCDPLGNRFFMQSVQVIDGYYGGGTVDINAKYGGAPYDYFKPQVPRLQKIGFNTIGEYAHLRMLPTCTQAGSGNPNQMPFVVLIRPATYAVINGSASSKALVSDLPPAYNQYRGSNFPDVFDPQWTSAVNSWFGATDANFCNGGTPSGLDTNPWFIGTTMDDTDELYGIKSGGHSNIGWMVGVSAPYMASLYVYNAGQDIVYADPKVYTKGQYQTYLTTEYGTIAALNAAWGSTYTTFGSTATTVTGETIGIGNGTTISFSHTFAHTVVDPASIGISVGGTLRAGDCPWFNPQCSGDSIGTGTIIAATGSVSNINGGTITYSNGAITITFSSAPASGVAITATYQYGGWPKATAGGTGLMDEDGSSSWYPSSPQIGAQGGSPISGTVATDLDHFYPTFLTQYFSPINARLKAALPHHLIFGPDSINVYTGSYGKSQVYTVEGQFVDVLEIAGGAKDAPTMNTVYAATSKPFIPYFTIVANDDSFFYNILNPYKHCVNDGWDCQHTQPARGTEYSNVTSTWWNNFVGADNYHYTIGWNWWQYVDRNNEQENFGMVSLNDNLYDGVESTTTKIVNPMGFVTTPETRNYGDFISHVKTSNRIWLGAP